ncbi:hypothetical protein IB691_13230, partial [Fangia hongkongensis]|nr:hypothetical protein [Fangia hongkongensis]
MARKIWIAAGLILEKKYKFYIPGGEIDLVQRHNIADYDRWAQDSLNAIAITQNNLRRSIAQLQGHLQNIDAQLSDLANSFPRENNEAIEISRQRSAVLLPSIYEAESDNSVPVPRENIPESYQSTHIKGNFNALDEIRKLPLSLKVIEYIAGNRPFKIAVQDHNQVQQVTVGCKDIIQVSAAHLASYIRARQSYMYSVVAGLMEEYLMVMATSLPVHLCFIKRNTVDFIHRPKSQYLYFLYAGKCFTEIITCLSLQQFHRLFCQQNKAHLSTQYDIKRLRGDLESLKKEELAIDHPLYGRLSRDVRKRIGKYIKNTASLVEYSLFSMNRIQSSALDHFAMSASSIYLSGDRGISASGELVSGNVMHYTEHEMLTGKMMGFMKTMHLFPLVFRHNTQGAQAFIDGYLNIFRLKSLDIKNGKESQFILKVQKEFLLCKKQMTTLILLVEMRDNYFIEEEVIEYKGICQLMGLIIASLYLYTIDIIDQMVRDKEKVLESYNKRLAEFCIKHSGFTYIKEFDYAVNK